MVDIAEIYVFIAQAVSGSIPEEWERAVMMVEKQEGMVKSGVGYYTDDTNYLKPFNIRNDIRKKATRGIFDLHAITTAGGHNRWNFLWLTLLPSGAYEIEFIWNQDAEDKLAHIGQTEGMREPARSQSLRAFMRAQAERSASQVYAQLVRAVVQLIPEEWTTANVSLRELGLGIVEYHASYQPAGDELYITQSWTALRAVEDLQYLKRSSGHPDWQQVTFEIAVGGTYRATFTTTGDPADGYTYDGQWLVGAAS